MERRGKISFQHKSSMLTAFRAWATPQLRVEEKAKGKKSHELKAFYEDRYLRILSPETSTILVPTVSGV